MSDSTATHFIVLENRSSHALELLLQALFDNVDDALFELADRAVQNTVQNMYFESMREIRMQRRTLEQGFFSELQAHFELLHGQPASPPRPSEPAAMAAVDSLALVAQEELEELVATDAMIAKARGQYRAKLDTMSSYIDALLTADGTGSTINPLAPQIICRAFVGVCRDLDLDIKAKLVLFKLFDRYVMADLESVYAQACSVLTAAAKSLNVEPKAVLQPSKIADDSPPANGTQSLFSDLQGMIQQQPSTAYPQSGPAGLFTGLAAPGQASQIPQEKLFDLLQVIQRSADKQFPGEGSQALAPLDVRQMLDQALTASMPTAAMSINQPDDDAINLVAMLFQYILDDRNLATAIKGLICRLQIPIVKVAMQDKSFFSTAGHPARKLLNEIAYASMGWSGQVDNVRDPLYDKVSEVVSRLVEGNSVELYQEVLTDFVAFVELTRRRTKLVEQRTINAEDGKAKAELARAAVQSLLAEKIAGRVLQPAVEKILREPWSNVLFLRLLKREQEPEPWHEALQWVDDLLWSVGPINDSDARRRLMVLIPPLLQQLRIGLLAIAYNHFEMNKLFVALEVIHLGQMQTPLDSVELQDLSSQPEASADALHEGDMNSQSSLEQLDAQLDVQLADLGVDSAHSMAVTDTESVRAVFEQDVPEHTAGEQATAEHTALEHTALEHVAPKHTVTEHAASDAPSTLRAVDSLAMGSWVEMHQQDGKKFRCRLAAIIRGTDKYIFVNRSGMKVAEHNRSSLAQAITQGEITLLDEGLLFDRALESVIGSLRASKSNRD